MRFDHSSGVRVSLGHRVLCVLETNRQLKADDAERGGQLFGEFDGDLVRVRLATRAGPQSLRTRTSLEVDREHERKEIAALFHRGLHFVGTWHTHPESVASPSSTDTRTVAEQFRRSRHELKHMLMIVMGTATFPAGAWVGLVCSRGFEPMRRVRS